LERVAGFSASIGVISSSAPGLDHLAQMQPGLRGNHLPSVVDTRQNAAHHRQIVTFHGIGSEVVFEQLPPQDIEPPGRAGVRIVGRPLAKRAGGCVQSGS
jgi:hypothetical protein